MGKPRDQQKEACTAPWAEVTQTQKQGHLVALGPWQEAARQKP